ncbi:nucleotide-diphospho-sugar transferase [Xylariaceae sp. FL0804]|nr:nucleotide-diphospho-sugar transferase [Xylariaceae sp. FL0804]
MLSSLARVSGSPNLWFVALFAFHYLRVTVHIIGYLAYKPAPLPKKPTCTPADCTVILPTVDPKGKDFLECCQSVLQNCPGRLLVITVGQALLSTTESILEPLAIKYPQTRITVTSTDVASKRIQVAHGICTVETPFIVLVDDHVFWPSSNFLAIALAPFEDPEVGVVGTNKRVRRSEPGYGLASFFNFLGCIYLERHNFDIRATNAIDGGVFVVSGRTSLWRTAVVQPRDDFLAGFTNERFCFGRFGPLDADDDNFLTRWAVRRGWRIRVQFADDARVETTLGECPRRFLSQLLRWTRTTWRSSPASLFTDGSVAVFITSLVRFSLFYDALLAYLLWEHTTFGRHSRRAAGCLALWILAMKLVKLLPHFRLHPRDVVFLPGQIVFAYFHSFVKLYALFTFYVVAWGGRDLSAVEGAAQKCHG